MTIAGTGAEPGRGASLRPALDWLRRFMPTAALLVPLGWLVALPFAVLAASAFKPTGFLFDPGFTLTHIVTTWSDPELWRLIGRSTWFALGSSLLALALGVALAWLVERTDMPGAGIVRAAMLLPMAMPPFLIAIGWIILLSPRTGSINIVLINALGLQDAPFNIYTMGGMIFVEGLALAPSAFLILAPSFRLMDASLEESARMSGAGAWRILTRIVLPLLAPALAGAAIFLFIVSYVVFDIPGTIGIPAGVTLLSTHIYELLNSSPTGLPEYGPVSAIALLAATGLIGLSLLYQRLMTRASRFVTVTGKATRPRPFALGPLKPFAIAFVAIYIAGAVVLPMLALVWTSLLPFPMPFSAEAAGKLTLANHLAFLRDPTMLGVVRNSLVIGLTAAFAVTALAFVVSWVVVKTRAPGRMALDNLAFLPLAFPGVLMGTALVYVYLAVKFPPVYGTIWIIAIAHIAVYMSFASRVTNAAMTQLHSDLEDAAAMNGASWTSTMTRIVAPLLFPALAAVWIWVFSHSLRELSSALLLQGMDNKTVPTLLYSHWSQGQPAVTAAIGVWLVVMLMALIAFGQLIQNWAGRLRPPE